MKYVTAIVTAMLVLISILWYVSYLKHIKVIAELNTQIITQRASILEDNNRALVQVRLVERTLASSSEAERVKSNEQIKSIAAQRDGISKRLRIAEANLATAELSIRTLANSSTGQVITGNIGAQFPATIGQQDVEEAARADTIRESLISCYKSYDRVRETVSSVGSVK